MKLLVLVCFFIMNASLFAGHLPPGCEYDKECFFDAPGMKCGDGTQSYFTITPRKNARNLLVYLNGGGACWNKSTCEKKMAKVLTRVVKNTNWDTGLGIFNRSEPKNPFREDYDLVAIPYCTGDVYTGNRTVNYGTTSAPYVIQHYGYANVLFALAQLQKFYPFPDKVALVGMSAGGLGTLYHAKSIDQFFPASKKYIINDSGIPFEPPYVTEKNYLEIMKNWGADQTFPFGKQETLKKHNFGTLIAMNIEHLPNTRFGLIGAYTDFLMTFFAFSVGSPSAFTAVKNILIHTADENISKSKMAKVFYINSKDHTYLHRSIADVSSVDHNLGDWVTAMVSDYSEQWTSVRPDLLRPVDSINHNDFYNALESGNSLENIE